MGDVLHTGGAPGADALFTRGASMSGHHCVIHSFAGHRFEVPVNGTYVKMIAEHPTMAPTSPALECAARRLGRWIWEPGYCRNLLLLGMDIAHTARSLYAVGEFEDHGCGVDDEGGGTFSPQRAESVGIRGGTGWVCQAFADSRGGLGELDLYFFEKNAGSWWQLSSVAGEVRDGPEVVLSWKRLDESPPRPHGHYAGVGSTDLTPAGARAIGRLYAAKS